MLDYHRNGYCSLAKCTRVAKLMMSINAPIIKMEDTDDSQSLGLCRGCYVNAPREEFLSMVKERCKKEN